MQQTAERAAPVETRGDLWSATLDIIEAGQEVLVDRISLLRMELRDDVSRMAVAAVLTLPAATLASLAVVVASAALAVFLTRFVPTDAALALTALAILVLSGLFAFAGTLSVRSGLAQPDPGAPDA